MIDSSQVGLIFLNIHKGDLTIRIMSEWWTESFGPYSGSVTGYAY
jgi:hypothetical protein